jgi:hypothetical protein
MIEVGQKIYNNEGYLGVVTGLNVDEDNILTLQIIMGAEGLQYLKYLSDKQNKEN